MPSRMFEYEDASHWCHLIVAINVPRLYDVGRTPPTEFIGIAGVVLHPLRRTSAEIPRTGGGEVCVKISWQACGSLRT